MSVIEEKANLIASKLVPTVSKEKAFAIITILAIGEFIGAMIADLYSCYANDHKRSLARLQQPHMGDRMHARLVARASLARHKVTDIDHHVVFNAAEEVTGSLTIDDVAAMVGELT